MSDLAIDYTYANTLARCPRAFECAYELGIEPREKNWPMHAGRCGHEAIHTLYATDFDIDKALGALARAWGSEQPAPGSKYAYLTLGHMECVIRSFAEDAQWRKFRPIHATAEQTVTLEWDGLLVGGKPDFPVEYAGGSYVLDWKFSTAWVNEWWAAKFKRSNQLRIYLKLLSEILGVRFDGAYIGGVYMGEYAADPPEKWRKRASVPSRAFGPYLFQPAHLAETRAWLGARIAERDLYRTLGHWPQAEGQNCISCGYARLCDAHPLARTSLAQVEYVKRAPNGVLASGADSNNVEE